MKVHSCPGCDYSDNLIVGHADELVEMHQGRQFVQHQYNVCRCKRCGLYFKDEVLDEKNLTEYYNSFDSTVWNPKYPYPTETWVEREINKCAPNGLSILDYGCSDGRFLERFVKEHDCYGFDIDERSVKIASGKGIKMIKSGDLEDGKLVFDVVILSDVLEHSFKPTELVRKLFMSLKPNGKLLVSTGYADSSFVRFDISNYWYFRTVQHVVMMSGEYIEYLKATLNAKVPNLKICSHYDSSMKEKLISGLKFRLRFFLFKYISSDKTTWYHSIISSLPYLSRITKWKYQPYHPFVKDHVVIVFERQKFIKL